MKKLLLLCLILMAALTVTAPAWAAVSENFDLAPTRGSYVNWTYNGFHADSCICDSVGSSTCGNLATKAVRFRNISTGTRYAQLEYVGADSLGKDGGVGVFSFDYKSWANAADTFEVAYQVNGGAYVSLGLTRIASCATWAHYSYTLNNSADNIRLRIRRTGNSSGNDRLHVDNVSITDFAAAGNETDARIGIGGPGALPTISSLLTSEAQAQVAFSFVMHDEGTGTLPTVIKSLTIGQGAGNQATNWTQYINGAKLSDGTTTFYGTVNAAGITFSGSPTLLTLPNGGAWQTWALSVWLKPNLPFNADNKVLAFSVSPTSFLCDTAGASFNSSDAAVTSGSTNNRVDIVATRLAITTQPPAVAFKDTSFTMRAGFVDVNGGIDADFNEPVTLAVNAGTGVLSAVSGLTKLSTSGESFWNDLKYNTIEAGVILQATSPSYTAPVLTNAITFTTPPTIAIDCAPTCWDKDTLSTAMAFAVHITITNWLAEANHPVYVKVFNSTLGNPYHYTATYGWSSSTNYDRKPVVTLDANGNWSGWLALKSYGIGSFKPRAADVTSTSINITGNSVTGTLLDLTDAGNGAVLEDRDASTHSTPGDIILVRDGSNNIVGNWIVENNGYPLDEGASAIPDGGWRLALCAFCDSHVAFETWNPANWPGHGEPDAISRDVNFCIYPGESVEVSDVILPVELVGVPTATAGDASVTLNWITASENGNTRFDIVRDNRVVGRVEGAGTSSTRHTYKWTENGLDNGTVYTYTLRTIAADGSSFDLATVNGTPTPSAAIITEYALHQNFPNPFNPTTSIAVDLVDNGFVSLKVYNLMGQEVASLVNGNLSSGRHIVSFDASHLSSGLYLYRLNVNGFSAEKKMLLMK
ncbi:MAG TPA: T9SS type A sorting domain-containing protein [bacterium]|jgi:hypothetical protein